MHNWKALVRARLNPLPVDPARAGDIVDELAQHVAEHYAELVASGVPDAEAVEKALAPLADRARVAAEIARADRARTRGSRATAAAASGAGEPGRRPGARRPLRRAAASARARLRGHRAPDARARHRREHRDLQRAQRRAAAPAAVRGSGSARDDRRARSERIGRQRRLHHVPRLARAQPRVRGHGAHPLVDADAGRERRTRAHQRHARLVEFLPDARRAAGARARLHRRRGHARPAGSP